VRIFVCNDGDRARDVVLTFRDQVLRCRVEAAQMLELTIGDPGLADAMKTHAPEPVAAPV